MPVTFPSSFDIRLPITFIGQEIQDDVVTFNFELSGFEAVGKDSITISIPFSKDIINRLAPNVVVMKVREEILRVIGDAF